MTDLPIRGDGERVTANPDIRLLLLPTRLSFNNGLTQSISSLPDISSVK